MSKFSVTSEADSEIYSTPIKILRGQHGEQTLTLFMYVYGIFFSARREMLRVKPLS